MTSGKVNFSLSLYTSQTGHVVTISIVVRLPLDLSLFRRGAPGLSLDSPVSGAWAGTVGLTILATSLLAFLGLLWCARPRPVATMGLHRAPRPEHSKIYYHQGIVIKYFSFGNSGSIFEHSGCQSNKSSHVTLFGNFS